MADITAYTKQQADQLLAGKYSKPAEGVPKSDLASGVQASLEKADAALTKTDADATYVRGSVEDSNGNLIANKSARIVLDANGDIDDILIEEN